MGIGYVILALAIALVARACLSRQWDKEERPEPTKLQVVENCSDPNCSLCNHKKAS